jgi:hypothetical protein
VELGIAYCQKYLRNGEKPLLGLHTDTRAAFFGGRLNSMVRVPLDYIVDDEETLLRLLAGQGFGVKREPSDPGSVYVAHFWHRKEWCDERA